MTSIITRKARLPRSCRFPSYKRCSTSKNATILTFRGTIGCFTSWGAHTQRSEWNPLLADFSGIAGTTWITDPKTLLIMRDISLNNSFWSWCWWRVWCMIQYDGHTDLFRSYGPLILLWWHMVWNSCSSAMLTAPFRPVHRFESIPKVLLNLIYILFSFKMHTSHFKSLDSESRLHLYRETWLLHSTTPLKCGKSVTWYRSRLFDETSDRVQFKDFLNTFMTDKIDIDAVYPKKTYY